MSEVPNKVSRDVGPDDVAPTQEITSHVVIFRKRV